MEQTVHFETSEYKIQTPGNYSEENIHHYYTFKKTYITFQIKI